MSLDIKELVKDNFVYFDSYRQGIFYYRLEYSKVMNEDNYHFKMVFPVPVEDIGTATLLDKDKAITFMRWIRKAIADKTLIEVK